MAPLASPPHMVYLALGANLGDRDATLRAALATLGAPLAMLNEPIETIAHAQAAAQTNSWADAPADVAPQSSGGDTSAPELPDQPSRDIGAQPIVRIERVSSVYDTAPLLVTEQPRFHNIACMGRTWLAPLPLLHALKRIEARLGRVAGARYGPRALDIDILFYDDLILKTPELTIPHARIAERAFVLAPLAEIAPDLRHPTLGRDIHSLAQAVAGADVRCVGPL